MRSIRLRRAGLLRSLRAPMLSALAVAAALSVVATPLFVSVAEGCSGAPACQPTAFDAGSTGMVDGLPTDGWLRLKLETTGCAYGSVAGGDASIEVTDASGAKVAGGPAVVSLPTAKPSGPVEVEWAPSAPFAPGASYAVTVSGLATSTWTIPFTTGAGALSTPVVRPPSVTLERHVRADTSTSAGGEVSCTKTSGTPGMCQQTSTYRAPTRIQPRVGVVPVTDVELPELERQFFDVTHEVSLDGGAYQHHLGQPVAATREVCVVTVVTHRRARDRAVRSTPVCQDVSTLDLSPVDNCCEAKQVLDECPASGGASKYEGLTTGAIAAFERDCGTYTRGSASCHGAPTGADSDDGGCSVAAPLSERAEHEAVGVAALLAACALVRRRRR